MSFGIIGIVLQSQNHSIFSTTGRARLSGTGSAYQALLCIWRSKSIPFICLAAAGQGISIKVKLRPPSAAPAAAHTPGQSSPMEATDTDAAEIPTGSAAKPKRNRRPVIPL